jgi:hypothetical protein
MGDGPSFIFQPPPFEKSDKLFGFLNRRMPHGVCEDRAQKAKRSSQKVTTAHSYT